MTVSPLPAVTVVEMLPANEIGGGVVGAMRPCVAIHTSSVAAAAQAVLNSQRIAHLLRQTCRSWRVCLSDEGNREGAAKKGK
jgi:hypothetical protein